MARICILAVALLVALAGCEASPQQQGEVGTPSDSPSASGSVAIRTSATTPPSSEPQILVGDGFRTLVSAPKHESRQALVVGILGVGQGGCLIIHNGRGYEQVIVWPAGVTLLTDGRVGVNVPGVGAITVGESFSGDGGFPYAPLGEPDPRVPSECARAGEEVAVIDLAETIRKPPATS